MIYEIAEKRVDIKNKFEFTTKFCKSYLSKDQTSKADIEIELTEEEFLTEKNGSSSYSDGYVENIAIYRKLCNKFVEFDRFIFHGAVLEYENNGYIFTGRSGSGKTTHTSLWLENVKGAKILNGDKPIVAIDGDKLVAYGTPWNGKEGRGYNGKAEIKCLCFIDQAKENKIVELNDEEKVSSVFKQILIPKNAFGVEKTLEFANKLVSLPIYRLYCDISEDAVKTSFEKITGENYQGDR